MPKERRKRISQAHQSSAKIVTRIFALPEEETERLIQNKECQEASANELFRAATSQPVVNPVIPAPAQTKKEKKQLKHELLLQRLTAGTSPYSKSHNRRLKRKAKSNLSTDLASVEKALQTVVPKVCVSEPKLDDQASAKPAKAVGLIGEGKGATLSKKQRQKALELERLRQTVIAQNPDFKGNPFAAIRTHAQNSLLSHDNVQNTS
ncbi:ribosome biogenesis protein SLX9 [Ceratobasidium sp. AG-Ba]|nr:ribosome biogenesis protein SLX9 [Ceratobasidium sp. AG-Ba]QRW03921.1 ribosome biogenesis protein SLX9 [Ceratobasidium sp. AG-Ba]